jgi:hypothetical protein
MPNSFGNFVPTVCGWPLLFALCHAISSNLSLPLYLKPFELVPPFAANSHSASVGNLYPFALKLQTKLGPFLL